MPIIRNYPEGSDITILGTEYHYPKKLEDGKYDNGDLFLLYRDNTTGKKHHQFIANPDYTFYMANDDVYIDHNLLFIDKNKVHPVTVPYKDLEKTIAELTDNTEFYYQNIKNGNKGNNKELHHLKNVFGSKSSIVDHYRFLFGQQYKNTVFPLNKAYFDIEVDTIDMAEDFPQLGECPINAIAYINQSTHTIHSFLLRNEENNLIEEFENEVKSGKLFDELENFILEALTPKLARKYNAENFKIQFHFYDEEIRLIQDFFLLVNLDEPDFLVAWNMAFDIPYIVERVITLGYNPEEIMCHKGIDPKYRRVHYYLDTRAEVFAERGDYYDISSHTIYLDQLIHFASRRKGQKAFDSYKLDFIGQAVAKVRKLDYSHITTNISKLPYLNYKVFVFYNIVDTLVQYCIEAQVKDLDYIFSKALVNNTNYNKIHRQTVYLTNRAYKEWLDDGLMIGNGKGTQPKEKYPGALVSEPLNNSDYSKLKLDNQVLNIVENMCDFDYKALYPTTACQNNMGPNTQIGKIKIENQVHDLENPFENPLYDRGGQFIEDLTSGDLLSFGHRWLHLGSYTEILDDIMEYFTKEDATIAPFYVNGLQVGMQYYNKGNLIQGMQYLDNDELKDGMHYHPDELKLEDYFGGGNKW